MFVKLKGDLNGDGVINMADVMILAQSFGKAIGNPGVNEKADLNNDGVINSDDAIILAQYFGKTKSAEVVMF
uniref:CELLULOSOMAL FAMILY-48 PROCESSIVE GLYCOSIDE HYDROLASE n=1 Tax=Pseudobacteroides cellulosolvens TaxID=35825 RepID=UPI0002459468|nr:Chain B, CELLULOSOMAL FAMILY-48 PROCESSIVE GLYCOSIDE HYDROLASE [Pseudobacteroides cellulosolvens]2Y3N_D Chain D, CELLULOSOMAL FAMILY-48 PROCESSIVE GLYCOSIDE HYDROLASE [Pseudobacteroides cellulosolvens]